MPIRVFLLTLLSLCLAQAANDHFRYTGEHGQSSWCEISKTCCGNRQSPIGLYSLDRWITMPTLYFNNYTAVPKRIEATNNGHTIIIQFSRDVTPSISGGGLKHRYLLHSVHFHWGKDNSRGSEHVINGQHSSMEMHLVHYNSKFASLDEAAGSGEADALAVVGVLFDANFRNYDYGKRNDAIDKIASTLESIRFNGQSNDVKPFALKQLLPTDLGRFFRYFGSLTTPNCNEVVAWTVMIKPNFITDDQLNMFRSLYATKKGEHPAEPLVDNFRYILTDVKFPVVRPESIEFNN